MRARIMRMRLSLVLAAILIVVIALASAPSSAGRVCYRVRVAFKGLEVADTTIPLGCKVGTAASVTTQNVGDTTVETTRYAAR